MMHGAAFLASAKRSRTRPAPAPANTSTNSEADTLKKGTPASPATAFANNVLPVPGGPASSAPFGIFAPKLLYRSEFLRKSTTSMSSCLAPSHPATSSNLVFTSPSLMTRAGDFVIWNGLFPPSGPPAPAPPPPKSNNSAAISHANGPAKRLKKSNGPPDPICCCCMTTSTLLDASLSKSASSTEALGTKFTSLRWPSLDVNWAESMSGCTRTISTFPLSTCCRKSEYDT
mmetsp:Transcript_31766/g.72497  ORF Transcript_31766/g.72497 Transcript_31766/m.72497 type:complete len:230 (-) Transcript_31766:728-1417(-)